MTRWIGPAGVERGGMEVESVWLMIISLVLNVFSCMSLSVVQISKDQRTTSLLFGYNGRHRYTITQG